jgi:glutathione-regulated potassium-efflux system ancillary protein KefG
MSQENKILILFAHPVLHKSRINKLIIEGLSDLEGITFHNLYETYPDFHLDIKKEQLLLLEHQIIIWHHPFYWYGAPAIIKEWIDLVLEHGFAYGSKGKALQGKMIFNALTTGGRRDAYVEGGYNNYTIKQFLYPFQQTANLCKMIYLPPFVVHGSHVVSSDEIRKYALDYKETLMILRDGGLRLEELVKMEYMNEILELIKK